MENIKWHKLFNKKKFKYVSESKKVHTNPYQLARIISPNLTKKKFGHLTNFLLKEINVKKNDKFLDFGSGNGAFLIFFRRKVKKLYSMDISKPLIDLQKKRLDKTKFIITNPFKVNFFKKLKNDEVDVSISNSVFHYFYSDLYCKKVLSEMIRVTKKTIFIYDIKDKNKKKLFFEEVRKRQNLSLVEFKNKYKDTPQRLYYKSFFSNFLKKKFPKIKFKFLNLPKGATDKEYGYCLKISKY